MIFEIQHSPEQHIVADPALSRAVGLDDSRGLSKLTHEGILWFIIINSAEAIRDFGILLYSFFSFSFHPQGKSCHQ